MAFQPWKSDGGSERTSENTAAGIEVAADAADLKRTPVTPELPSFPTAPTDPKWVFVAPQYAGFEQAVGGNERIVLISGDDKTYIVDAESGTRLRTIVIPERDRAFRDCRGFRNPNKLFCTLDNDSAAVLDVATGAVTDLPDPASRTEVSYSVTGDTVVAVTKTRVTAYDDTGRTAWSAPGGSNSVLDFPDGTPAIPSISGTVFTLRDVATGRIIYTYDAGKTRYPEQSVNIEWTPFASGFSVVVDNEVPSDAHVDFYDSAGKKTSSAAPGWLPAEYGPSPALTRLLRMGTVTPLPLLTNDDTKQVASFDPATGKPVVTAQLDTEPGVIMAAVSTTVVVSHRPPPPGSSPSASANDLVWFDVYDGSGGSFNQDFPNYLGTDGERMLLGVDRDRTTDLVAYGADDTDPLWRMPLESSIGLRVIGGKVYDGKRRLL